jgi:type IV secretory pathway TrbF-like protein
MTNKNIFLHNLENGSWNDLRSYHRANEGRWRIIAIITIITMGIVSIASMIMINQDKHKVIVFTQDGLGNLTLLGMASKTLTIDNKIVAHQLVNFIYALREAPADLDLKKRNINLIKNMIMPQLNKSIDKLLINQYLKAGRGKIFVTIKQIKPFENEKSWLISWQEQLYSPEGNLMKQQNYSSVVSFQHNSNIDNQMQLINPVGLFVSYINPVEDVNDEK